MEALAGVWPFLPAKASTPTLPEPSAGLLRQAASAPKEARIRNQRERRQECVALPGSVMAAGKRLPKARVDQKAAESEERGRAGGDEYAPVADYRSDLARDD